MIDGNYLADNAGPGIEVEISEDILVSNNLSVRNGLVNEPGNWQYAGILLAESMRCDIQHNTCVNNRRGIAVGNWVFARWTRDKPYEAIIRIASPFVEKRGELEGNLRAT
jgi:hypothetical protein